jgi:hypothetical protein
MVCLRNISVDTLYKGDTEYDCYYYYYYYSLSFHHTSGIRDKQNYGTLQLTSVLLNSYRQTDRLPLAASATLMVSEYGFSQVPSPVIRKIIG